MLFESSKPVAVRLWDPQALRGRLRRYLQAVRQPLCREKARLTQAKWKELPEALKVPQQAMGRAHVSCGATHGVMEKCDLACTSCYLSEVANKTPPLPFGAVKKQLDLLRAFLGPAGKAQITSGEVTLLPLEKLGRIVAYARKIGLDPMLMTNGQRLLEDRDYLTALVRDYGLEKVAIHIDTTQRGRKEMAKGATEWDIQPIRDRFAALLQRVRSQTDKRLCAAQTVTVTRENLHQIPAVMTSVLDHLDVFRMVSFQPTAEVGRTRDERIEDSSMDAVWEQVCAGVGQPIGRHAMRFGHPECNAVCPLLVVSFGGNRRIVEAVREGDGWDLRMAQKIMDIFGNLTVMRRTPMESLLRIMSLLVRNPTFALEAPLYALYRAWGTRAWLARALVHLPTLRIRPLTIVVHQFMNPEELNTARGQERLGACSFKVPVGERMVSMCEVNATGLRRRLNEAAGSPVRIGR